MAVPADGLLESALSRALHGWEGLIYRGSRASTLRSFEGLCRGRPSTVMTQMVIAGDDKMIWESFRGLMDFTFQTASASAEGHFEFTLLCADLAGEELASFNPANAAALIVNHARKLQPGQAVGVRYTSLYGILKKLIPATWGKIGWDPGVLLYGEDRGRLDLFLKKMTQRGLEASGGATLILHDLSRTPLFCFGEEPQTGRIRKWLTKNQTFFRDSPDSFLIVHAGRVTDLVRQFNLIDFEADGGETGA